MSRAPRPLDTMAVFWMMTELGNRERVARWFGYTNRMGLNQRAHREAKHGKPALLFALEAGAYIHRANRTRALIEGGRK